MYAIVEVNKKQYRVEKGVIIEAEKMKDAKGKIILDKVLLVVAENITIGRPYIKGAKVTASILGDIKAPKVVAFKYRRRKGYQRTVGHRQKLTRIKIDNISV